MSISGVHHSHWTVTELVPKKVTVAQIGSWYMERERAEETGQTKWGATSSHRRARAVSLTFFVSESWHQRCYWAGLTVFCEPRTESLSSSLKEFNRDRKQARENDLLSKITGKGRVPG